MTPSAKIDAGDEDRIRLNASIDTDAERLKGIFKDIHRNQELGFMEVRTAGIVAKPTPASASASARPW